MRVFSMIIAGVMIVAGLALAAMGYSGAFADLARSAVQQTVLELRLLNGSAGLLLAGIGALILRINHDPTPSVPEPPSDP